MKKIPFSVDKLLKKYPTPFYVYDQKGIINSLKKLQNAFSWCKFKEYFAVKATPNPYILRILEENGAGTDCSSMAELVLSEMVGLKGDNILFTSNNTPLEEYKKAYDLDAIINFDDIGHIPKFINKIGIPQIASIRYTPKNAYGSNVLGNPLESKFGMPYEKLLEGYKYLKKLGVKRFGLHAMIISNTLDVELITKNTEIIFKTVNNISKELNLNFEFIDIGGGFGIPYRPEEKELDIKLLSENIQKTYNKYFKNFKPKIYTENGRYITGAHGYLITKVLHIKESYKTYIGVDANMANLMRPGLYGPNKAYHHITVLGKENNTKKYKYDIVGSLCENNDKFAIDRELPKVEEGDVLIIHDVGAHGHSMGFNYNGKLRSAEFIYDGKDFKMIRRAETLEDYFSTIKNFR
ncbi:diaminopimelate decarboxylase [Marinitoga hydrogenitolerans DSM 16785]|uniref:Diaminopimelate decarboxylase n=1 Tax=Marinitoga hydrogenitolerans (strain DSM 16785 / JCM 12826 / AT1271) TaxID=1122195 RepID=A0A1M4WPU0_MARH1|nr:diaminopimelate decarboxylase [Marinitoga hydrogenitolerans]SHE83245.1 diaminopimelate decarboxylase [Marinitoga hydrogenitolerans DSM 16785]